MAGAMAGTAILNTQLTNSLHTVTLTINNDCNLSCPHCYLQYKGEERRISDRLMSFVCREDYKHLAIVGKEPLFNSDSLGICERVAELAVANSKTISLITNGLNLSLVTPALLGRLSYIDLSLDGGPETYSQYRKGSLSKIISGLDHLRRKGFEDVNALHVLSTNTIHNLNDMMRVRELFDFRRIMFSPYVPTLNFGSNDVGVLDAKTLFAELSASDAFMREPNALLLIGEDYILNGAVGDAPDTADLVRKHGLTNKVFYVGDDPLLHGIIRVTFDGYVLTPYQSLHTLDYRRVGLDLSGLHLESVRLGNIYQDMRLGYEHNPVHY